MAITAGSDGLASDFISTSSGAADVGKVAKLDASGQIDDSFIKHPNRKQEIVIPLLNDLAGADSTSGSYGDVAQAIYDWTAGNWDTGITWYFEAYGTDGSASPSRCNVQLYNSTDAAEITNLTVGQTAGTFLRSSALTMPSSGTKRLIVRFRNSVSSSTVTVNMARLVGVMPA